MNLALYFHIPYCLVKCPYCDFTSYDDLDISHGEYADALVAELGRLVAGIEGRIKVESVYLGGGTPSLLDPEIAGNIINSIAKRVKLDESAEITIEVNPGTANRSRMEGYKAAGINRVIIGMQSTDPVSLSVLGRVHSVGDAFSAFEDARAAEFASVGIDLIYGLPGQALNRWTEDLEKAVALEPDHVSAYILKPPTGWETLKEELLSKMYLQTLYTLENNDLKQYEVSNFARPGKESRHNLVYWKRGSYIGLGAAAHSFLNEVDFPAMDVTSINIEKGVHEPDRGARWANTEDVYQYIERIGTKGNAIESLELLSAQNALDETIALELRLIEGLNLALIGKMFDNNIERDLKDILAKLEEEGLGQFHEGKFRLNTRGMLLADEVAAHVTSRLKTEV